MVVSSDHQGRTERNADRFTILHYCGIGDGCRYGDGCCEWRHGVDAKGFGSVHDSAGNDGTDRDAHWCGNSVDGIRDSFACRVETGAAETQTQDFAPTIKGKEIIYTDQGGSCNATLCR